MKSSLLISITLAGLTITSTAHASAVRLDVTTTQPSSLVSRLTTYLATRGQTSRPEPGTTYTVTSTAYAPSPYQTDSTPCITAAGTRVRQGTVASNFLPLGTLLQINNEVYIVEDRMNPRHHRQIDVFFPRTSDAREFGKQQLEVTIIGYGQPGQALPSEIVDQPAIGGNDTEPPSFIARVHGRWLYLKRIAAGTLTGRVVLDPNRFDVDCWQDDNTHDTL